MRFILAVTLLLALAACVESAQRKCWTCDKDDVKDCDADTDTESCDGKCMKMVAEAGGYSAISRSCSSWCQDANAQGQGSFCCDTDKCNSATGLTLSITMALGAALWAKLA